MPDVLQHRLKIIIDFGIPKSEDLEALDFQGFPAVLVAHFLPDVAFSIQFNDEASLGAVEIDYVARNWRLQAELVTGKATAAKLTPQPLLSRRHLAAEFASA